MGAMKPFPLPPGARGPGARGRISELYEARCAERRARGMGVISVGGLDPIPLGLALIDYLEETEADRKGPE